MPGTPSSDRGGVSNGNRRGNYYYEVSSSSSSSSSACSPSQWHQWQRVSQIESVTAPHPLCNDDYGDEMADFPKERP